MCSKGGYSGPNGSCDGCHGGQVHTYDQESGQHTTVKHEPCGGTGRSKN